jgi:chemotaxis signal transduction protein
MERPMSCPQNLLPHMRGVLACERELAELRFTWQLIETTAKMVCPAEARTILPAMASTREAFGRLERELVAALAGENVRKVVLQMQARAQAVVDVVVRNLFERTADVGFLSTDADLRRFLLGDGIERDAVELRLHEYIRKYSVYDAIFVLGTDGAVRAAIGDGIAAPGDAALASRALSSSTYVEQFGRCALLPTRERALVYAQRIVDQAGRPLGVLCLSFRFDDEMAGIFRTFRRQRDRAVMLLLDADGRVIASSDPDHVALGRMPEQASDPLGAVIDFGGREYIARTCCATGYQGYAGPGWRGHLMVPAESAFRDDAVRLAAGETASGLPCESLTAIESQAGAIKDALNRVVWNGQVMASAHRGDALKLKSMLQQISETGERMRAVFSRALAALSDTITTSTLQDLQFVARLMMDVMDRNLYERANDCRWWALAPALREALDTEPDRPGLNALLDDINRLYTVYERLFVHAADGRIVACSTLSGRATDTVGRQVDERMRDAVSRLRGTQSYAVSPFDTSALNPEAPTYIYHAAVRAPDDDTRVVGGIGIVFESAREFRAMLTELLPARDGVWAAFCERDGRVVASTRDDLPPGSALDLGELALGLDAGASRHAFTTLGGKRHMAGLAMSAGYREYKTTGDYRNELIAVVALELPDLPVRRVDVGSAAGERDTGVRGSEGATEEFAVFRLDDRLLAITAHQVLEAADLSRVKRIGAGAGMMAGVLKLDQSAIAEQVPVINLRAFFGLPQAPNEGHVVVTCCAHGCIGLVVDELISVIEREEADIRPVPDMLSARFRWLQRLFITTPDQPLVLVFDLEALHGMLRERMHGTLVEPEFGLPAQSVA